MRLTVSFFCCCFLFNSMMVKANDFSSVASNKGSYGFKENKGQIKDQHGQLRPDVLYSQATGGLTCHLRQDGWSYQLHHDKNDSSGAAATIYRTDIQMLNVQPEVVIEATNPIQGVDHYFKAERNEGITGIKTYGNLIYKEVFAGIDLHWYTKAGQLEYDFIVGKGADYTNIRWTVKGAERLSVDSLGQLVIETPLGSIIEAKPMAYQGDTEIEVRWVVRDEQVSFSLGPYDDRVPLIIDPIVGVRDWSTYYGHTGYEQGSAVETDNAHNLYLAGFTKSSLSIATSGAHQTVYRGSTDAFIAKFDSLGTRIWGTYFGGSNTEEAYGITLDGSNNCYITGWTRSDSLVATLGTHQVNRSGFYDAFLVKFDNNGILQWSTYFGGIQDDLGRDCAVNDSGQVFVVGETRSDSGIATAGSLQSTRGGGVYEAFVARFDTAGRLDWSTFYGGSSNDFARACVMDRFNNLYVVGNTVSSTNIATLGSHQPQIATTTTGDAFIAKLNSQGQRIWATYYGGSDSDIFYDCTLDAGQNLILAGRTNSDTGIATPFSYQSSRSGSTDAMLIKFFGNGIRDWGTYMGGPADDHGSACAVDQLGRIYMTGITHSISGISTFGSHQPNHGAGNSDSYIAQFNNLGFKNWGTYFGGFGVEHADGCAAAGQLLYVTGRSSAANNIASSGAHQTTIGGNYDAFLARFSTCQSDSMSLTVSVCDSFVSPSNKHIWYYSGLYYDTLTNMLGCDSLLIIDLNINSTDTLFSDSACYSYTSPSGKVWTNGGLYFDTLTNALGCDSILRINLFINASYTSFRDSACSAYLSPSGRHLWKSSGIYQDTLTNSTGCDSVLTINLTLLSHTKTLTVEACDHFVAPESQKVWTRSGSYPDTLKNLYGCDSVVTYQLTIYHVDTTVVQNGTELIAAAGGDQYQWLECDGVMSPIPGATNRKHTPTLTGRYAVAIRNGICWDTSACFLVNYVGISSQYHDVLPSLYPNPTSGYVTIDLRIPQEARIELFDAMGAKIRDWKTGHQRIVQFYVLDSPGIYWVRVQTDTATWLQQVVRE